MTAFKQEFRARNVQSATPATIAGVALHPTAGPAIGSLSERRCWTDGDVMSLVARLIPVNGDDHFSRRARSILEALLEAVLTVHATSAVLGAAHPPSIDEPRARRAD